MVILVTGGSGFIGRHLITRLLSSKNRVIAFCRNKIPEFSRESNFQEIEGDLITGKGLENVPWDEIECVIHLAAAGVKASQREWHECMAVNILGTERLLQWIKQRASKIPKVFLAKTFYEKLITSDPSFKNNPYIATKEISSQLAELWSKNFKGTLIFGTLYHTFGPGDDPLSVLSYAARHLKENKLSMFSSGKALGDWLYIDDTISGILAALEASSHGVSYWDIGSGKLTSIHDLVESLRIIAGRTPESVCFDPTLDRTNVLFQEAAQHIPPNFTPAFTLEEGLRTHYYSQS